MPLILFPWASGLLSGITTSFIKGAAEMVKTETVVACLTHPLLYVCLAVCAVTIVG